MRIPTLDDYKDKYPSIHLERTDDGILTFTLHTEGSDHVWGGMPHEELHYCFNDISADAGNKVVIFTSAGDSFIDREKFAKVTWTAEQWARVQYRTHRTLTNFLDIEVPIISAIVGPASVHAELALLGDIVIASDTAYFQDAPHFPSGIVPGDGVQVVWPMLLGPNRARYFLLTGQRISAQEALALGIVAEVMSQDKVKARAMEIAKYLLTRPPVTLALTKSSLMQDLRRRLLLDTRHGLMAEGLAGTAAWPEEIHHGGPFGQPA